MAFNIIDGTNIHGVGTTEAEKETLLKGAGKCNESNFPKPIVMQGTYPPEMVKNPGESAYGSKFPFKNTSSPKKVTFKQPEAYPGETD